MDGFRVEVVPVTPLQQNCTLLWDQATGAGVVVDPGGDVDDIVARLDANAIRAERILLTHGHLDHAGGAGELARRLGVPVDGPDRRDAPLIEAMVSQGARFGMQAGPVTPDRWLSEGDVITFGPHRLDVLFVPGHSPGHVVFVERTQAFAQVGDTLFAGSVGRTDLPGGDHATLIDGIRSKLLTLGDEVRFVCGHGLASSIGRERRTNPFLAR